MKLVRMFGLSIRDAARSLIRNLNLSFASISCITITLTVVAVSMIASYNVDNFTKLIKQDVTMVVFLDKDITQEEINDVETQIRLIVNVDSYEFQSKEEAKQLMQESSEVLNKIMTEWDEKENPLQDAFLIKVLDIENIKITADEISKLDNVSVVKYGEGMIEQLLVVFNIIEKIMIGLILGLVIVTFFLITNTIKITIFSRKREIDIMRLVGASNITIKMPYIIEGLFLGFLGSIIPIIITIYGYYSLFEQFGGIFFSPFIQLVKPEPFIFQISLILIGMGMFIGMWGSASAVRKHLKI